MTELIENNRKRQWNRKQLKAILILGDPSFDKTNKELASIIGVGEATIYRWKRILEFNQAVSRLITERVKSALPKIWSALVRYAQAGDPRHIKLFFELIGQYKEQPQTQINIQAITYKATVDASGRVETKPVIDEKEPKRTDNEEKSVEIPTRITPNGRKPDGV